MVLVSQSTGTVIHISIFNVLPDKLVSWSIFRKSSKLKIKVGELNCYVTYVVTLVSLEERLKNVDFINSIFLSLISLEEFFISSIFLISQIFLGRSGREGFSRLGLDGEFNVTLDTFFCCFVTFETSSKTIGIIWTCWRETLSRLKMKYYLSHICI